MKWYIHTEGDEDFVRSNYTITTNSEFPGWDTDMGYDGYGLPKELAQWICDKLNESKGDCPFEMIDGEWKRKL